MQSADRVGQLQILSLSMNLTLRIDTLPMLTRALVCLDFGIEKDYRNVLQKWINGLQMLDLQTNGSK